jgi:transcriptional regulator with XRE-family HTH domain
MNIGRHLQKHRERRNITLRQIADATKLSTTALQHIERNDFARLPGGIFIRAYLRSFAVEVGASPDEVVRAYVDQFAVVPAAEEPPPVRPAPVINRFAGRLATAGAAIVLALVAYGSFAAPAEPPPARSVELLQSRTIAQFVGQRFGADRSPGVERPARIADRSPGQERPARIAADRSSGQERPARIAADPSPGGEHPERGVRLEIQPTAKTWVSARADGKRVVRRFLKRGERVVIVAQEHLFLYVGKTKGFAYTLNGATGRPLGEVTKPVTVHITGSNYRTFQAGAATRAPITTTN